MTAARSFPPQVVSEVREHFGDRVFETMIPRSTRLAEAPSFGKPIIHYDKYSAGAAAYEVLAQEFLARLNKARRWIKTSRRYRFSVFISVDVDVIHGGFHFKARPASEQCEPAPGAHPSPMARCRRTRKS